MRTYEITFILKPDLPEEEVDRFIAQMEGIVTSTGGTIRKIDKIGQRRLAYLIGRYKDGLYVMFSLDCEVPTVREFERRLRVTDSVIKFLTVRVDEELKRVEKLHAARAKKLAKKKPKPGSEPAAAATA